MVRAEPIMKIRRFQAAREVDQIWVVWRQGRARDGDYRENDCDYRAYTDKPVGVPPNVKNHARTDNGRCHLSELPSPIRESWGPPRHRRCPRPDCKGRRWQPS